MRNCEENGLKWQEEKKKMVLTIQEQLVEVYLGQGSRKKQKQNIFSSDMEKGNKIKLAKKFVYFNWSDF